MRHFFSAGLRLVISLGEAARKFEGRSRKSKNTDQVCHRVTHCYRLIRILFKISTTSSPRALQRIHSQLVARQDETFCQRLQSSEIRLIRQSVPDSHHQRSLHSLASPNLDGRFGKIAIHSSRATNSCRYLPFHQVRIWKIAHLLSLAIPGFLLLFSRAGKFLSLFLVRLPQLIIY